MDFVMQRHAVPVMLKSSYQDAMAGINRLGG
jgi:hypothetical protein